MNRKPITARMLARLRVVEWILRMLARDLRERDGHLAWRCAAARAHVVWILTNFPPPSRGATNQKSRAARRRSGKSKGQNGHTDGYAPTVSRRRGAKALPQRQARALRDDA